MKSKDPTIASTPTNILRTRSPLSHPTCNEIDQLTKKLKKKKSNQCESERSNILINSTNNIIQLLCIVVIGFCNIIQ